MGFMFDGLILLMLSNARDVVASSKQNIILLGQRVLNADKVHVCPLSHLCFSLLLKNNFKPLIKKSTC